MLIEKIVSSQLISEEYFIVGQCCLQYIYVDVFIVCASEFEFIFLFIILKL